MPNDKTRGCPGCSSRPKRQLIKDRRDVPVVKEDGSLLFKRVAPTMPGYVHHPHNMKLLVPDKMPCTQRITLPVMSNGNYWLMNRCNCPECPLRGEDVNDDICGQCDYRLTTPKRVPLPSDGNAEDHTPVDGSGGDDVL